MKNKRLVVTVCVLIAAALAFAYVRAQVLPDRRPAPPPTASGDDFPF